VPFSPTGGDSRIPLPTNQDDKDQKGDQMKRSIIFFAASSFVLSMMSNAFAQHAMTDAELMQHLKGAGPDDVVKGATIMNSTADGKMKTIQAGKNGWTCMDAHGIPMCADKAGMEWVDALMSKGPAPQKLGFIYMLKGTMARATPIPMPPRRRRPITGSRPDRT